MAHRITTPSNFAIAGKDAKMEFRWNSNFGSKYTQRFNEAQRFIDSESLRYGDPLVPFKDGHLKGSAPANSRIGEGAIGYNTPYARKMYYDKSLNFNGAPQRGAFWFERMKSQHKDTILRGAGRIIGGN